jgi:phosphodiesterase/alkaline phosphatase D-like protein
MSRALSAVLWLLLGFTALSGRAAAEPRQIHISVVDDDPSAMTFWWVTRSRTDFSEVQYGLSEEAARTGKHRLPQADRRSQWRHGMGSARYDSPYIHEVVVRGLDFDSTYYYRVGSWEDGYSKVYSFRTRPADPDATVTFVWFGDQVSSRWLLVMTG